MNRSSSDEGWGRRALAVLDSALDAVICVDGEGRVVGWNGAATAMLGWERAEAVGRPVAELLSPTAGHGLLHDDVSRALTDRESIRHRVERTIRGRNGEVLCVESAVTTTEFEGRLVATLFLRDITAAKRSEARRAVEHRLARVLAAARSGQEIARGTLEMVGTGLGFDHGELWVLDAHAATLRLTAAWRRGPMGPFAEAGRRIVLGRGEDLAGLAWEIRETVCVDDAGTLEGLTREAEIRAEGIRGCAALPLSVGNAVVGVVVWARGGAEPIDAELRQTLHSIGVQLGHFAERRAAERRLEEETVALAAVARSTRRLTDAVDEAAARTAIVEAALQVSGAGQAFLALPDPEGSDLLVRATAPDEEAAARFGPALRSAVARSFESREAVFVSDAAPAGSALEGAQAASVVSGLLQPIVRNDRAIGVLGVGWNTRQATLDHSTRLLIRLLAGEAAMALSRVELVTQLESAARTDPLTGLANLRGWEENLRRELAASRRDGRAVAVAVLDLDGFKALNDDLGHQGGDRVLRSTAAAWQAQLRDGDLLARLGGDEFAALLPGCHPDDALSLAERLRTATEHITVSIGVAYWIAGESIEDVMVRADAALYSAKAAGRDRVSSR